MGMKTTEVMEYEHGLYVWELPDGSMFKDEEGGVLSIPARFGDLTKISQLSKTAAHYGQPAGKAVFKQGARQVSKSEWEDQMERLLDGKVGDPYDLGNIDGQV